jgi:sec-independent protein translocase protein TatA
MGIWELVIIAILVVVIFGGRKLPELGKGLGQGLANFRRAMKDMDKTGATDEPSHRAEDERG